MSYVRIDIGSRPLSKFIGGGYREILVTGRPGGGKTYQVVKALANIDDPVVFVTPLKRHRDAVAHWFKQMGRSVYVLKARYDMCTTGACTGEDLLSDLLQCLQCPHFRKRSCDYYRQFREIKESGYDVLVTTHALSPVTMLPWFPTPEIYVIDEVDAWWRVWARPINKYVVDTLLSSGDEVLEALGKWIVKNCVLVGNLYEPVPKRPRARQVIYITATVPTEPKILNTMLMTNYEGFITYSLGWSTEDYVIACTEKLYVFQSKLWFRRLIRTIIDICELARGKGLTVGIVSRNMRITKSLHSVLTTMKYRVASDVSWRKRADIYVITVAGKVARGLNLPDCDIVVAMWQHQVGIKLPTYLAESDNVTDVVQYIRTVENWQTLFRFIRDPRKQHIVILLDQRLYTSRKWNLLAEKYLTEVEKKNRLFIVPKIEQVLDVLKAIT